MSLSREYCKESFTPPQVLCNSWCAQVGYPPSWGDDGHGLLTHLWYSFNTLGSSLEGSGSLYPSIISQRSMDTNNILILNFQRLNFFLLNLSMILTALLTNYIIIRSNICSKNSNNKYSTSNIIHFKIIRIRFSTSQKNLKKHSNQSNEISTTQMHHTLSKKLLKIQASQVIGY